MDGIREIGLPGAKCRSMKQSSVTKTNIVPRPKFAHIVANATPERRILDLFTSSRSPSPDGGQLSGASSRARSAFRRNYPCSGARHCG